MRSWVAEHVVLTVLLAAVPHQLLGQRPQAATPPDSGLPLQESRVVEFEATEGTWMSLDVSPDGRAIVFELLGDLYELSIAGGDARRLTSGPAFNRQPRYSPDGRRLAYVSDRSGSANIWIANRDGSHAHQLSKLHGYPYGAITSPAWSPSGKIILASQMLGATRPGRVSPDQAMTWLLAAYEAETGRMRWISDTAAGRARATLGATFASRDDAIYASVEAQRRDLSVNVEDWRISRIGLASGRIQPEMWSIVARVGMRPAVSRDGRYLVYVTGGGSQTGLRIRDLLTDGERWLVRRLPDAPALLPAYDSRDLFPGYAFTPDSRSLVIAYGGKIRKVDIRTGQVATIRFVAQIKRGLGPLHVYQHAIADTAVRARSILQPALSPDGRQVAFSALDRIWVLKLPSGRARIDAPCRATSDSSVGEFYPSWSPDGKWIVYSTWQDSHGGAIRRVRAGDTCSGRPPPSERLTSDTALYFHTVVSADGQRIATVRGAMPPDAALTRGDEPVDPTLTWLPITGGTPHLITRLTTERPSDYHEWYRYPTDQLYLTSDASRLYLGLTSWRWDGTDRQTAVVLKGLEDSWPFSAAGILSPDRSRAIVTARQTLSQIALPQPPLGTTSILDLSLGESEIVPASGSAVRRWGPALAPWVSWSGDGSRVLFSQGSSLFLGDVIHGAWISFARVDVPLMVSLDTPRGTMVLRGARLITMRGNEIVTRGDIVIRDNRIAAIGPTGQVSIPVGARIFDMTGATILPGYVDLHDHMFFPKGLHPQQFWGSLIRLSHGVTTSRDPQPDLGVDVFAYSDRERAGDLISPRVLSTGMAYQRADPPIQSLDDALAVVRPNAVFYRSETFKIHYDAFGSRRTQQLLAIAAAEYGLNATIHGQGLERELTAVSDGYSGVEHAPFVRIYDDVATFIARSGTTHTQTYGAVPGFFNFITRRYGGLCEGTRMRRFAPRAIATFWCDRLTGEPWNGPPGPDDVLPIVSGAALIVARGGRVGIGSHLEMPGPGIHYEMWLHALGGMSAHNILRSATLVGATALGHERDLGSLEAGKLADLQVLAKDPLENIHETMSIRYVMKNGRLYQADDLAELWPQQKRLGRAYLAPPSYAGSTPW